MNCRANEQEVDRGHRLANIYINNRQMSERGLNNKPRAGCVIPTVSNKDRCLFPVKLHCFLTDICRMDVDSVAFTNIRWCGDGKSFEILNLSEFETKVLPSYFNLDKLRSFYRQLNLYEFERVRRVCRAGIRLPGNRYTHKLFVRDQPALCQNMRRRKTKKTSRSKDGDEVSVKKKNRNVIMREKLSCGISEDMKVAQWTNDGAQSSNFVTPDYNLTQFNHPWQNNTHGEVAGLHEDTDFPSLKAIDNILRRESPLLTSDEVKRTTSTPFDFGDAMDPIPVDESQCVILYDWRG